MNSKQTSHDKQGGKHKAGGKAVPFFKDVSSFCTFLWYDIKHICSRYQRTPALLNVNWAHGRNHQGRMLVSAWEIKQKQKQAPVSSSFVLILNRFVLPPPSKVVEFVSWSVSRVVGDKSDNTSTSHNKRPTQLRRTMMLARASRGG